MDPQTTVVTSAISPEVIAAMSAATVTLAQIFKSFVSRGLALPLAGFLSLLSVVLWAWSNHDLTRESAFGYWSAYGLVLASAAGVFGLINQAPERITDMKDLGHRMAASIKGTGGGTGDGGN